MSKGTSTDDISDESVFLDDEINDVAPDDVLVYPPLAVGILGLHLSILPLATFDRKPSAAQHLAMDDVKGNFVCFDGLRDSL